MVSVSRTPRTWPAAAAALAVLAAAAARAGDAPSIEADGGDISVQARDFFLRLDGVLCIVHPCHN